MCLSFGIRNSCSLPSRSVMISRCLPLVSLPKVTVPVTSASMPASFGERASNSSATRGRPPVMSRVFCDSVGIRASTSPTATCCASRTTISAPIGKQIVTACSVPGIFTSSPASLISLTCGRTPLVAATTALGIDDDQRRQAGDLVDLLGDRHAFLDVLELHGARVLGDDRAGQRIPARELRSGPDRLAVADQQASRRTAPCGARARGRCRRRS